MKCRRGTLANILGKVFRIPAAGMMRFKAALLNSGFGRILVDPWTEAGITSRNFYNLQKNQGKGRPFIGSMQALRCIYTFSTWIIQSCRDWSLAICPYTDDLLELRYSCFCNGVVRVMESGDRQCACFIKCSMPHTRCMHASPVESLSQGLRIVLLSILLCTSIDLPECFVSRGCDGVVNFKLRLWSEADC